MELVAERVSVGGAHEPLLLATSVVAPPARVTLVAGDSGYGHVALSLALGGRMQLASGTVSLGGDSRLATLQRHVALVDVPDVTAPLDALPVHAVIAEELALAGRPCRKSDARAFLEAHGAGDLAGERFEAVRPGQRTAWLSEIAAQETAARVLVLGHPDRHGGDPSAWWPTALGLAGEGLTVVVQCTHLTIRELGQPIHYELGVTS